MDNAEEIKNELPDVMFLQFADAAVPVFKEVKNRDYIEYGARNVYPEYLTHLFNKSGKHNAIVVGKSKYIFGKGYANGDIVVNRLNESLNDITKKSILDIEIYGGFRWEVIWNFKGVIAEIYHVDFNSLRKGKDGGFWHKDTWKPSETSLRDATFIHGFDESNRMGTQIYEYNEYRPGVRFYPLPGYIGSNNYIETDIEISKYYLSAITNGMMPSKMIQFFKGDPPDEKKREIEKRFTNKYSGAGNAGKLIMVYNDSNSSKSVEVSDLSASDLDKQFVELNKTTQQEIFSGHNITSPMLFGIKTEGQLGGNTELQTAYSIFQNTYAEPKADAYDKEANWLLGFSNFKGQYKLRPTDPIGLQFDVKDVINSLPKQFVFKELGIPEEMWELDNIGGTAPAASPDGMVNDNIKNLTGRQMQGIQRIVRKHENPNDPMTREQAVMMLKKGYGLEDDDIIAFLGEEPLKMSAQGPDEIISMFDACGDSKNDFEILKSKKVRFDSDLNTEDIFIKEAFKTIADVTTTEKRIIDLIRKDPLISSETIAATIGETLAFVESKIETLVTRGYIESEVITNLGTETISRTIPKGIEYDLPPGQRNPVQIFIKYSYEGPKDNRNRPFCAKLLQLNRLYSRAEIEKISERLGYSVFDRGGGFWNQGNGVISPSCRHTWKSNIVVKKGGSDA